MAAWNCRAGQRLGAGDAIAGLVDYKDAEALLSRYGIRTSPSKYVGSAEEAVEFSAGEPIALKVITPRAPHKSRLGLVALGLTGRDITKAFGLVAKRAARYRPYRMLAQRMSKPGIEIILGGNTDPQFGKMVLIGLGGIYVEAFRDFALRVCPISDYDAESMIDQLRSGRIVAHSDRQRAMLSGLIVSVSHMFVESALTELDLNPVILHDDSYDVVDVRLFG